MAEKKSLSNKKRSADWLVRGVLTKVGGTLDRFTGRRWTPSSSIAASELIERIKKLLDAEAKTIPGKGTVVPHNIKLKMQWDKFSADAEDALKKLEYELLTATIDHINDSLYYTYAPVTLEVKPDYFVEGVKLFVSFDKFADDDRDVEMNVTVPAMNVANLIPEKPAAPAIIEIYIARFETGGSKKEKRLEFTVDASMSVGRTGTNALMIEDPSVSKMHASLSVNIEGRLSVADTGSTNGTFINDQRIAYGKAMLLEDADKVRFGVVEVEFEHAPRPVTVEPAPEDVGEDSENTVEIDGFQFTSRTSPDLPQAEVASVEVPDETIKIDTDSRPKTDTAAPEEGPTVTDLPAVAAPEDGQETGGPPSNV